MARTKKSTVHVQYSSTMADRSERQGGWMVVVVVVAEKVKNSENYMVYYMTLARASGRLVTLAARLFCAPCIEKISQFEDESAREQRDRRFVTDTGTCWGGRA